MNNNINKNAIETLHKIIDWRFISPILQKLEWDYILEYVSIKGHAVWYTAIYSRH